MLRSLPTTDPTLMMLPPPTCRPVDEQEGPQFHRSSYTFLNLPCSLDRKTCNRLFCRTAIGAIPPDFSQLTCEDRIATSVVHADVTSDCLCATPDDHPA